jgi:predicted permease
VRLDLAPDSGVLLFVLAVSFAAALVCGLIPALRATRGAMAGGLQQGSRGATAAPSRRLTIRASSALQLGLSVVLIAAAFLFAFSLHRLTGVNTGVDRRHLLVLDVDPKEAGYRGARMSELAMRLLDRVRAVPGVESTSFSQNGLYTGRSSSRHIVTDQFTPPEGPERNGFYDSVGPGYFATLGTRLIAGRDISERDDKAAPKVAVINMEFARHFFPEGSPMGCNIYLGTGPERKAYQVVGVVEDVWHNIREAPRRTFYVAEAQNDYEYYTIRFLLRTADPARVAPLLGGIVRAENSALRVESIQTADQLLNRTLDLDRLVAALSFAFGVLAVMLAAVGVYGLLAYDVARRTPEIGIRMALGATRASVAGLVFREVTLVGAAGIAAGLGATLALGHLVEGMVFELRPGDPRVLAGAVGLLALVAIAAALTPASRAARMEPMQALRTE